MQLAGPPPSPLAKDPTKTMTHRSSSPVGGGGDKKQQQWKGSGRTKELIPMIIVPKVGETLPVLGTLAAGSSVGWGLLLLQKLFKKPIEESIEIEYKVDGSWENPELVLISEPDEKLDPLLERSTNQ